MLKKPNVFVAVALVMIIGVFTYLYLDAVLQEGVLNGPDPDNAQLVKRGKQLYQENCADCHGVNLEGEANWRVRKEDGTLPAPPHDKTGHTWHHPDNLLFEITKFGGQPSAPEGFTSAMPGFQENLTDDEIWMVLTFIKSRWPAEILKRQTLMSKRMSGD